MALNPAIADAYRKVVVTTGAGGTPGTTVSQEVGGELNLDAGFGISLVADVVNNKVTIVNTGNGTGALTTITENNANGTFYPIFSRSPPGTQTFTVGASDFVSGAVGVGVAEVHVVGTTNDVYGVSANMRAAMLGIIEDETFSLIRVSTGASANFTATGPATYDSINGYWVIPVNAALGFSDTFVSITIATGAGELNPLTGTYQMDTMYLDTTTTPLSYLPSVGTLNVTNIDVAGAFGVTGHLTVEGVTSTGATGTGKFVFDTSPSVSNPTVTGHATIEGVTATGATGTGKFVFDTSPSIGNPTVTGHATIEGQTLTGVTGTGKLVLDNAPTITSPQILTSAMFGPTASANLTRFPNALAVVSNTTAGIQQNEPHNIGLMAEGVANNGNSNIYGIGVYGVGYTSATTRSGGVVGEGHVSASSDVGASVGVRGYATDTHSGGVNIGLYGNAGNSTTGNYSLYMYAGDIYSGGAQTWYMNGNLAFNGAYTVTIPSLTATNTITGSVSGNAGTVTNGFYTSSSFNLGTTSIAVNRSSTAQSLTGITSIDGYAAGLAGGNATTLLGSLPYQSAANTTSLLSPNTTTTRKFVRMTGDGTNGTAPAWDTVTQTDVGLSNVTNESKATMFTDPAFTGTVSLAPATFESVNVAATSATGTVNVDVKTNTVWYYTATAGANWTFNFRGDGSNSLNAYLSTGHSITVAFMVTQGATAWYPTAFTVDSTASGVGGYSYSVKWLGAAAPTGGNASSVDSYTFTIIKTADKTFTIIASQARFA